MSRLSLILLLLLLGRLSFGQSDIKVLYDSAVQSGNLELAQKVNLEAKEINDLKYLANSYYLIGYLQKKEEAYYESASNYFEALVLYRQLKDDKSTANVIENIANIYHLTGFHDTALQYYSDAVAAKARFQDSVGISNLLAILGLQYQELERFDEALSNYNKALNLALQENQTGQLYLIYNQLGRLNRELENYSESESSYKKALLYADDDYDKAGIYNNIGFLKLTMLDTTAAYNNFRTALNLSFNANAAGSKFTGTIYSNIGKIYEAKKSDSAHWFYERSYFFLKDHALPLSEQFFKVCKKLKTSSQERGNLKQALVYSEDIDRLTAKLLELRVQLKELYNRYQVEAATYKFQHQEKAKALEKQMLIDHYIKWALTILIVGMIFLTIILYRKNRKIRFARDTARKIYQMINSK